MDQLGECVFGCGAHVDTDTGMCPTCKDHSHNVYFCEYCGDTSTSDDRCDKCGTLIGDEHAH